MPTGVGAAGVSAVFADETGVTATGFDCARRSAGLSGVTTAASPNETLRLRVEGSSVFFVVVAVSVALAASGRALDLPTAVADAADSSEGNVTGGSVADGSSRGCCNDAH